MSLIAKATGGGADYDPIPEGTYEAVCYSVVDLGTHHNEKFGKDAHKVLVAFEVPDVRIEVERDGKTMDLPRAISKRYTMSLHKKAALRHDLESWRGRAFTDQELAGFDLHSVTGAACLIGVIHERSEAGKTYARISSIMACPRRKGVAPPKAENEIVRYAIPDGARPGFGLPPELPPWVAEIIRESHEWTGKGGRPEITMPVASDDEHGDEKPGDDLPF
jgi:hypothetical protein